jgi:hypothetical protein
MIKDGLIDQNRYEVGVQYRIKEPHVVHFGNHMPPRDLYLRGRMVLMTVLPDFSLFRPMTKQEVDAAFQADYKLLRTMKIDRAVERKLLNDEIKQVYEHRKCKPTVEEQQDQLVEQLTAPDRSGEDQELWDDMTRAAIEYDLSK